MMWASLRLMLASRRELIEENQILKDKLADADQYLQTCLSTERARTQQARRQLNELKEFMRVLQPAEIPEPDTGD